MMSLADVLPFPRRGARAGVKEYYLTGGEPFLNPELPDILEAALAQGPACVLTNGLLIREETARRLRALSDSSEYSLDVRVSLDGIDAHGNDAIRGEGTFERALAAIRTLAEAGLNPVVTLTQACEGAGTQAGRARLLAFLRGAGLRQPRLKVMPLLRLGAEVVRTRGYEGTESLEGLSLTEADTDGAAVLLMPAGQHGRASTCVRSCSTPGRAHGVGRSLPPCVPSSCGTAPATPATWRG
jgi:molybdenum cofactor biosynthesis enzyme MoaA